MKFQANIELGGKTATGIEVPPHIIEELGAGKRPPVRVTIGDYTYRSTVASRGGRFMLPVSADVRHKANVTAGDTITVGLELDTAPREVTVPDDLAAALDANPQAKQFFDQLSYSNKQWHVLNIEAAKTAETRERRIQKSLALFRDGKAR